MNPRYADFDTYHMAASAIDEAIRNCVAVGANPSRTAILDNFCWADCNRPEMLGSLVRAALACRDVAIALGTPFISGKDSLNNEFRCADADGHPRSIAIPPSLLISALGQVDDVRRCVTMDLKKAGSVLYQVGLTKNELGGSHYSLAAGLTGGRSPQVDPVTAKATFAALHRVLQAGYVLACHDLSEGGLAVAAAEMAIAGRLGTRLYLTGIRHNLTAADAREIPGGLATALLFSESNSRFLVEVPVESVGHFEETLGNVPHSAVGEVLDSKDFVIADIDPMAKNHLIETNIDELTNAWKSPLNW
jgi:phosphoribosylformylglycinamidine synthase